MLKALTKTGVFTLEQGSDHCLNFIRVRDVALATETALAAPGPFAPLAYNISSGEYWQLGDVAALVRPMFPSAGGVGAGYDYHILEQRYCALLFHRSP